MSSIAASFTVGTEVTFENLTILPLLSKSSSDANYDTLDAALGGGTLDITEVSESGSVPEIKVQNRGTRPVLIIDGEELVGAKQNRTVNLSILVPPSSTVVVPVTCVDVGRWNARSRNFTAAPRTHFSTGRAAKSSQINASLRSEGVARADQSQVWRQIAKNPRASRRTRRRVPWPTSSRVSRTESRRTLGIADRGRPGWRGVPLERRADGRKPVRPSHMGEKWRLFTPGISGGALTVNDNVVHLSAFRS